VVVFVVLAVMTFKDFKGGAKRVRIYKKLLKIFKAVANVVLLAVSAVSMAGMGLKGIDAAAKIVAFSITFAVALVQLGLKVAAFAMKIAKTQISKKFKVEFVKFVDGEMQKKSATSRLKERRYKDK
ncbi:MAG: hypothetical protein NC179_06170, partial [[Eubacterium] siraeum]|nr:hypothetical protein [[Eubacterium] siraeum]